jgi:hypothetical protein
MTAAMSSSEKRKRHKGAACVHCRQMKVGRSGV